jgi:carbonic anhydrase
VTSAVPVRAWWDVPPEWRDTPVGDLLAYQNLGRPHGRPDAPSLLVGTCMDGRVVFTIPRGFAFLLRTAGANLGAVEGNVSYVLSTKGVEFVAVVTHTGCGAVGLESRRDEILHGLARRGWSPDDAKHHVDDDVIPRGIDEPVAFALREARRLESKYRGVRAAPLLYDTEAGTLSLVRG